MALGEGSTNLIGDGAMIAGADGAVLVTGPLVVVIGRTNYAPTSVVPRALQEAVTRLEHGDGWTFEATAAALQELVIEHNPPGVAALLRLEDDALVFLFDQASATEIDGFDGPAGETHTGSGRTGWTTVIAESTHLELQVTTADQRASSGDDGEFGWAMLEQGVVPGSRARCTTAAPSRQDAPAEASAPSINGLMGAPGATPPGSVPPAPSPPPMGQPPASTPPPPAGQPPAMAPSALSGPSALPPPSARPPASVPAPPPGAPSPLGPPPSVGPPPAAVPPAPVPPAAAPPAAAPPGAVPPGPVASPPPSAAPPPPGPGPGPGPGLGAPPAPAGGAGLPAPPPPGSGIGAPPPPGGAPVQMPPPSGPGAVPPPPPPGGGPTSAPPAPGANAGTPVGYLNEPDHGLHLPLTVTTVIGSDPRNERDVVSGVAAMLTIDDPRLNGAHVKIGVSGTAVSVEDLSGGGTWIQAPGGPMSPLGTGPQPLQDGTILRIGARNLVFRTRPG